MRRRGSLTMASAGMGARGAMLAGLVVVALAGCSMPAATAKTIRLPIEAQSTIIDHCWGEISSTIGTIPDGFVVSMGGSDPATFFADVGVTASNGSVASNVDPVDGWHIHATERRLQIVPGLDQQTVSGEQLQFATKVSRQLVDCMQPFSFTAQAALPSSRAGLLQLYRYDVGVLWPCLREHGFDPGRAPMRDHFVREADAAALSPFGATHWSNAEFDALVASARYCPQLPDYLTSP